MARKKPHEDHQNHEAWAIPYGDLVTLLLALFVVLYSMSSVNEGKYRVLSDSLNEAFGGKPRSPLPIQIGESRQGMNTAARVNMIVRRGVAETVPPLSNERRSNGVELDLLKGLHEAANKTDPRESLTPPAAPVKTSLERMSDTVRATMGELIANKQIVVRQSKNSLEIEIRTDILFQSGAAQLSERAQPVLARLAGILKPFPNPVRIEGHTDNVPISTMAFPSNWQLSAARAASVVTLFMQQGVEPTRMIVAGFGEYHPVAANDTAEGRNHNRRVLIVVLGEHDKSGAPDIGEALAGDQAASADEPAPASPGEPATTNSTSDLASLQSRAEPPLSPESRGNP